MMSPLALRSAKTMITLLAVAALASCGGGGGGGGDGTVDRVGGSDFLIEANVSRDSCGERLANVRQVFTIDGDLVDTTIFKVQAADVGGTLQGSYSEAHGDCVRTYQFDLDVGATGTATLLAHSECGGSVCETEWKGTLSEVSQARAAELRGDNLRINGERCNANVPPTVGYRPSAYECNGNAAIVLRDNQRNNYSVVVRRDGEFNDRDPNNPSCGSNRCSPYKTQKRMELPEFQVNCLGDNGFSDYYATVKRMSIKYTAQVTNPMDTSQFEQYCINNTQQSFN